MERPTKNSRLRKRKAPGLSPTGMFPSRTPLVKKPKMAIISDIMRIPLAPSKKTPATSPSVTFTPSSGSPAKAKLPACGGRIRGRDLSPEVLTPVKVKKEPMMPPVKVKREEVLAPVRVKREVSIEAGEEGSSEGIVELVSKSKKHKRKNVMKPSSDGSWLAHAGAVLVYRCVLSALGSSSDYRECADSIDWSVVSSGVTLTKTDISLIWLLIRKEYGDKPLQEIKANLKPFTTISADRFTREEMMVKLKSEKPKAPLTAFMLFSQIMRPKFKEKYPDLSLTQVATKIGKKWKSLGPEKQLPYRDEYSRLRVEYNKKMDCFLEKHPEAKPRKAEREVRVAKPRKVPTPKKEVDPETLRVRELKNLKPKYPPNPFLLYCKAKEGSVQKKYPHLSAKEVREKLSKRWKLLASMDSAPYRKDNIDMQSQYEADLKQFYAANPDAKELLAKKRKPAVSKATSDEQVPAFASAMDGATAAVSSENGSEQMASDDEADDDVSDVVDVEEDESDKEEDSDDEACSKPSLHHSTLTTMLRGGHVSKAIGKLQTFLIPLASNSPGQSLKTRTTKSNSVAAATSYHHHHPALSTLHQVDSSDEDSLLDSD